MPRPPFPVVFVVFLKAVIFHTRIFFACLLTFHEVLQSTPFIRPPRPFTSPLNQFPCHPQLISHHMHILLPQIFSCNFCTCNVFGMQQKCLVFKKLNLQTKVTLGTAILSLVELYFTSPCCCCSSTCFSGWRCTTVASWRVMTS